MFKRPIKLLSKIIIFFIILLIFLYLALPKLLTYIAKNETFIDGLVVKNIDIDYPIINSVSIKNIDLTFDNNKINVDKLTINYKLSLFDISDLIVNINELKIITKSDSKTKELDFSILDKNIYLFFNKLSINKLLIIDANDFYETDDILLSNNNTYIDLSAKIIKPFKINTYLSLDNNNIINAKINLQHNINKFKLNLKSNIKIKKK